MSLQYLISNLLFFSNYPFSLQGNAFPVGGAHFDPVTNLIVPIELGSIMIDPISEQPVTIMGVTIDEISGDVVPIGGMTYDDPSVPILFYDQFTEVRFIFIFIFNEQSKIICQTFSGTLNVLRYLWCKSIFNISLHFVCIFLGMLYEYSIMN